jgi:hypothetical protein
MEPVMYERLDNFMAVETWSSRHPRDKERFFIVLHELLENPEFNPDKMAEYMREKVGIGASDDQHPLHNAINDYTSAAWAIKEYLDANGL